MKLYNYIKERVKDSTHIFLFDHYKTNIEAYNHAKTYAKLHSRYAFNIYNSDRELIGYGVPK